MLIATILLISLLSVGLFNASAATSETMFGNTKPSGDYQQYGTWGAKDEIGNIFQSSVDGQVTKARFYASADETGSHNVSIWNYDTATCIAGPFAWTPATGEGWKEYTLASAVSITAGVNYIVVVSTGDGSERFRALFSDMVAGNNGASLSWPAVASKEGAPGTMPTTVNPNHFQPNYRRDVVFEAGDSSAPPSSSEPDVSSQPDVSSEAVSSEPASSEAVSSEPASSEAISSEPASSEAVSSEPPAASSQPAASSAAASSTGGTGGTSSSADGNGNPKTSDLGILLALVGFASSGIIITANRKRK